MKRIILIGLLLLNVLASSAQIQRKFLGFTLGSTSKTAVYNYLKTNHIKFIKNEEGEYCAEKVKFAGEIWEYVWFSFYNGKLYNVDFSISEYSKPIESMDLIYKRLDNSLSRKYAIYYDYNESTSERKVYRDNTIQISFLYRYFQGSKSLSIMYTYLPILNSIVSSEDDEL